jgi:hypothetical protein
LLRHADGAWRWKLNWDEEREVPELSDCIDVDLGCTPSTNTLPIRRLNLEIGESREVTAAWVRFPALSVQPLRQRYTRLGEHAYRYESGNDAYTFTADLAVDDLGLVTSYPPAWQRIAST